MYVQQRVVHEVDRRREDVPAGARHARTATRTTCGSIPKNNQRMIESDDGGAEVSVDGGKTWSDEDFATAQFYHVIATNHFPYHICGAQQDNSTLCGPSQAAASTSSTGSRRAAASPAGSRSRDDDPDIVYAGSYGNLLTRKDHAHGHHGERESVARQPDGPPGDGPEVPLPVDLPDHRLDAQPERRVRRLERRAQVDERRQELDRDLARPHLPRSRDARQLGRSAHEGPDVGRVLRDGLRDRGVAGHGEDALDRLRRRQGVSHARRRREVDRRHAEGHGEVHARLEHRRVEVRRVHRVRRGEPLSARRRQAVSLEDDRLRRALDAHRQRASTRPSSRASCARIPASAACSSPAPSAACGISPDDGAHWQTLRLNLPIVPVHDLVVQGRRPRRSRRTAAASTSWTTSRRSSR